MEKQCEVESASEGNYSQKKIERKWDRTISRKRNRKYNKHLWWMHIKNNVFHHREKCICNVIIHWVVCNSENEWNGKCRMVNVFSYTRLVCFFVTRTKYIYIFWNIDIYTLPITIIEVGRGRDQIYNEKSNHLVRALECYFPLQDSIFSHIKH